MARHLVDTKYKIVYIFTDYLETKKLRNNKLFQHAAYFESFISTFIKGRRRKASIYSSKWGGKNRLGRLGSWLREKRFSERERKGGKDIPFRLCGLINYTMPCTIEPGEKAIVRKAYTTAGWQFCEGCLFCNSHLGIFRGHPHLGFPVYFSDTWLCFAEIPKPFYII